MRGLFVGGAVIVYFLAFAILWGRLGEPVLALTMFPIVVAAWGYGLRGGLVASIVLIGTDVVLMQTVVNHPFHPSQIARIVVGIGLGAVVGWARDMTVALNAAKQDLERKVEERTRALKAELAARKDIEARAATADRMAVVGTLTAGIGHELNNPLAIVLANLDHLASLPADRETSEALRDARDAARRAADIVANMRLFVQNANRGEVSDVRNVVTSTVAMLANEIKHRAKLELDVVDTPPVPIPPDQLGQIVLNLLVNALHALPETGEHRIRVETRASGRRVTLRVSDTGAGIPPDMQNKIFEPFFTTKPVGVGTGLGLWVCHHIATSANGELVVESSSAEGTTFRLELPAVLGSNQVQPMEKVGVRKGKVLVIDDDPSIRRMIGRYMRGNHDVITEENAQTALVRIEAGERFDAIVCDMMMPEMTGAELHAKLVAMAPDQAERMIFMSGGAFTPETTAFLAQRRLLEKPFEASALEAAIQNVLDN